MSSPNPPHSAAGFDERRCDDGERPRFLGVARRGKQLARFFEGADVQASGHGAPARSASRVMSAGETGQGVQQDDGVAAHLNNALGAIDGYVGDAKVTFELFIVR